MSHGPKIGGDWKTEQENVGKMTTKGCWTSLQQVEGRLTSEVPDSSFQ